MRFLPKWSALTLALASGSLLAQPALDPVAQEARESGGGKDGKDGKDGKKKDKQRPIGSLSVEDMQVQLAAASGKTKADARHVMHLRELARKQKDVIKLTCVNDKLIQLKAQQNIFGALELQLQAALADGQGDRFGLFTQVTIGAESIRKLREEADACLGEGDLSPSESDVDVASPDIIDDPTKAGDVFQPGVEPPGYASPFR
ncbi:MAG TPA: hypothetical protein VN253_23520 [Kofleriaceae bacterium]|nr:hypothetical protein [Kofleriaceae bacterium]